MDLIHLLLIGAATLSISSSPSTTGPDPGAAADSATIHAVMDSLRTLCDSSGVPLEGPTRDPYCIQGWRHLGAADFGASADACSTASMRAAHETAGPLFLAWLDKSGWIDDSTFNAVGPETMIWSLRRGNILCVLSLGGGLWVNFYASNLASADSSRR